LKLESCFQFIGKLNTLLQKSKKKRAKNPRKNGGKFGEKRAKSRVEIRYLGRFIEWPKSSMVWDSEEGNNMLFSLLALPRAVVRILFY
jgi:hypothetical protein